jgi:hypothetical protein
MVILKFSLFLIAEQGCPSLFYISEYFYFGEKYYNKAGA